MFSCPPLPKGTPVLSRSGTKTGITTGSTHKCGLAGCTGVRIAIRWPSGKHTFPCSESLSRVGGHWQIS